MRIRIFKNSVDISDTVLVRGTRIVQEFGGRVSTMAFSIVAYASDPVPVDHWDVIEVYEAIYTEGTTEGPLFGGALPGEVLFGGAGSTEVTSGDKVFKGYVTNIARTPFRGGSVPMISYGVQAQDGMLLLDRTVVPSVSYSSNADNTAIATLFSTYLSSIATSGVSFVSNVSFEATNFTLRQLMDQFVGQSQAHYYLTPDDVLHYHNQSSEAADFSLSEAPDNVSSFGFHREGFKYSEEFQTPCNKATVVGKLGSGGTAISQTYQDAASQALYGVRAKVITKREIASAAEALAIATAEVQEFAYPRSEGRIAFSHDGLQVGQLLTIAASSVGCSGSFRVSRLSLSWEVGKALTRYEAEFGVFLPDLVKTLREVARLSADSTTTPVAIPPDNTVSAPKLTTDSVIAGKIAESALGGGLTRDAANKIKLGTTDISNMVMNPGFEDNLNHWSTTGTVVISTVEYESGLKSAALGSSASSVYTTTIRIRPGEGLVATARIKVTSGTGRIYIGCYTEVGAWNGSGTIGSSTSASWTTITSTVTAPAGTAFVRVVFDTNLASGVCYVDSVLLRRVVQNTEELANDIVTSAKITSSALGNGITKSGSQIVVNLSTDGFQFGGSGEVALKLGTGLQISSNNLQAQLGDGLSVSANAIVVNVGGGLEVSVGQVQVKTGAGLQLSGGYVVAKYNSTYLTTNGSGELEVNGVRAQDVIAGQLVVGVTIVASQVISGTFTGLTMTLTNGGLTTNLNNAVYRGSVAAFHTVDASGYDSVIRAGWVTTGNASYVQLAGVFATSGYGRMELANSSGILKVALGASSSPYIAVYDGTFKVDGINVVGARKTGWGAPTGVATRTTFATSTVTLTELAERVHALIDDLTTHGLIGA